MSDAASNYLVLTAQIVSAHVGHNAVRSESLPELIQLVYSTLSGVAAGPAAVVEERPQPAVPIKKSIFTDYIVCLEDGKHLKMLKRHLQTAYNMTPVQYRERWGLPADYPMVAPSYAAKRSTLAKEIGLGRKPGNAAEAAPVVAEPEAQVEAPAKKKAGRPKKAK